MIKNLVFDLGNVLIEWNSEKILTYFEPDEEDGGKCLDRLFLSQVSGIRRTRES